MRAALPRSLASAAACLRGPAGALAATALVLAAAGCDRVVPVAGGYPDFTELAERASPSVVNISTISHSEPLEGEGELPPDLEQTPFGDWFKKHFGDGQGPGEGAPDGGEDGATPDEEMESLGSGFVLWSDGYILTNRHVVSGADEIVVRLLDRRQMRATVIGTDERSDLALIKIDATGLPAVKLGDSSKLRVAEWVLAIGSPFGFDHTVTAGIVSAKGRSLASEQYVPFIQTDVAINQGNSGGPLFNLRGEVIGINSQIYSQTGGYMGISFAIPIDVAVKVATQLKEQGKVSRGWLGVVVQEVTRELAESFGMNRAEGALVSRVMDGSPAAQAGLRIGDVILTYNGNDLARSDALPPLVGNTDPGQIAHLEVLREGQRITLDVEVGVLEAEDAETPGEGAPPAPPPDRLGLAVEPLNDEDKDREDLPSGGVLVTAVGPGPGREAGIREGDVLLTIGGNQVETVERFDEVVGRMVPGQTVPILVQRRGSPLFLALTLPAPPAAPQP